MNQNHLTAEFSERLRLSGMPTRYLNEHHFDNRAAAYRDALIASFDGHTYHGGWLILAGNAGTGKTSTACCILRDALAHRLGRFITAAGYLSTLKENMGANGARELQSMMRNTSLLVLDDYGKEKETEWGCEKLFDILDFRYANRKPTIITTNYSLAELYRKIERGTDAETAGAFSSRISARGNTFLRFDGKDMRRSV
ncbi:MAG: ATP-binding protein [Eggerthellaceae bacterium]|jgi:DNA replication protein DnaC|nr:ATP-binding protein [Eggerthellaceae bacterium]MCH4220471.1 ATP-binding protein [Eggerthellaceae bacterium]